MSTSRVPVRNWTGFYIGGHVGSGWGTTKSTLTSLTLGGVAVPIGTLPVSSHNLNGFVGGGQLGYNWQPSPYWLVGVEGDFSWSGIEGTTPCLVAFGCTTKVKWVGDITGRVGVVADKALVYLKGGAAWAESEYSFISTLGGTLNATTTDTRFGFLLGMGLEYAFMPNWSAKIEYNYIDFGKEHEAFAGTIGGVALAATADINQQLHIVKAGVNYRF